MQMQYRVDGTDEQKGFSYLFAFPFYFILSSAFSFRRKKPKEERKITKLKPNVNLYSYANDDDDDCCWLGVWRERTRCVCNVFPRRFMYRLGWADSGTAGHSLTAFVRTFNVYFILFFSLGVYVFVVFIIHHWPMPSIAIYVDG